ncbi:3-oxoacyl-ACP synthase III family protein [Williamsia sp.]|uniref:3-oxoacyl-ACP synthase III family protein n=1 Tax=Williamsia sp. TaxID=1872085 RepID=UPI002F91C060
MNAPTISLVDVASYLPENRVPASYFAQFAESDDLADNLMFRAPAYRHHAAPDETSAEMIERAMSGILDRHGSDVLDDVDILITHSQLPELPVVGCGGEVSHRLGIKPEWVIDVHNGGCASFIHMMKMAQQLMIASGARKALIANAQNSAGQVFVQDQVRGKPQASIPGDGSSVGLLEMSEASPILATTCRSYGEFAGDMTSVAYPQRKYWEAGPGQVHVGFTEAKISKVLARGNRLVPEVAYDVADKIGVAARDIDWFITNQPNRIFLRNWRDAMELPPERHPDTFEECGNLFGVGVPLTLDTAITDGRVGAGDIVLMAAFAHAGDYAGAAAIRWGGR